jgi:glycerol-3-phosphate dehydrogenase
MSSSLLTDPLVAPTEDIAAFRPPEIRQRMLDAASKGCFDVAIIGGGINGACLFDRLSRQGARVLLLDRGDFAGGTSQASGMMIWGGLLYLRKLDLRTVCKLSRARDRMIQQMPEEVMPSPYRYIIDHKAGRSRWLAQAALAFYWLLSRGRRTPPCYQRKFDELRFLNHRRQEGSLVFEEGLLRQADSRFVLHWITRNVSVRQTALNHCELEGGAYDPRGRLWTLNLSDGVGGRTLEARARYVVNCAGVWTDAVNRAFHIQTPYRHALSKGVYLGLRRPKALNHPLIFEMGEAGDTLTLTPWGPVALWGPTETAVASIEEGRQVTAEDVEFLLRHYNRNLGEKITRRDIVSLRCGIRPLAVRAGDKADCYPLDLSRRQHVVRDPALPWISTYGGKLTGCIPLAEKVARALRPALPAPRESRERPVLQPLEAAPRVCFPGLDETVPSLPWCVENELCCTLEDYLRRRTNLAQWVPRGGLGATGENRPHLLKLAAAQSGGRELGKRAVDHYTARVDAQWRTALGVSAPPATEEERS